MSSKTPAQQQGSTAARQSQTGAKSQTVSESLDPQQQVSTNPISAHQVMQLQRTIGNQAVGALLTGAGQTIQRVYAKAYGATSARGTLNASEGRDSPVNNQPGHPRQHVGSWEKAERFAEEQGKTKSVYKNTAEQDKAISGALSSAAGQTALGVLDATPAVASRQVIKDVATDSAEVLVVKAKKKKGSAAGEVKSWSMQAGTADKATVVIDSMGDGSAIHLQTAYPVKD